MNSQISSYFSKHLILSLINLYALGPKALSFWKKDYVLMFFSSSRSRSGNNLSEIFKFNFVKIYFIVDSMFWYLFSKVSLLYFSWAFWWVSSVLQFSRWVIFSSWVFIWVLRMLSLIMIFFIYSFWSLFSCCNN